MSRPIESVREAAYSRPPLARMRISSTLALSTPRKWCAPRFRTPAPSLLTTEVIIAEIPEKKGAAAGGAPDMGGMM